jgi:hypothetical protein
MSAWQPMETMPEQGQVIVAWQTDDGKGRFDTIGRAEYLEIMGFGEPPAFGWMPFPSLAAPPPQQNGWQPIASVPDEIKDNQTPILLWTPHTAVVGSCDNDEWYILGSRYVIEVTHWRPLPDPPTE